MLPNLFSPFDGTLKEEIFVEETFARRRNPEILGINFCELVQNNFFKPRVRNVVENENQAKDTAIIVIE